MFNLRYLLFCARDLRLRLRCWLILQRIRRAERSGDLPLATGLLGEKIRLERRRRGIPE